MAATGDKLMTAEDVKIVTDTCLKTSGGAITGQLGITDSTESSSKTTGALTVSGGVGVGGTVYANGFNGSLTGTASMATADADGNTISSTYLKITNIANNLTTTASEKALDARQGKELKDLINAQIQSQKFAIKAKNSSGSSPTLGITTIALAPSTRGLIFGLNNSAYYMALIYRDGSGNTKAIPIIINSTYVTLTDGANEDPLTIANTTSRALPSGIMIIEGSITSITNT